MKLQQMAAILLTGALAGQTTGQEPRTKEWGKEEVQRWATEVWHRNQVLQQQSEGMKKTGTECSGGKVRLAGTLRGASTRENQRVLAAATAYNRLGRGKEHEPQIGSILATDSFIGPILAIDSFTKEGKESERTRGGNARELRADRMDQHRRRGLLRIGRSRLPRGHAMNAQDHRQSC